MALPRTEVSTGLLEELARFKGLIQALTPAEWATVSRCTGWTVGDVAAHVIGGMADVAAFRLEGLGTPEVTARQVAERQGRSPGELADELGAVIKATGDPLAFVYAATGRSAPGAAGLDESANIYRVRDAGGRGPALRRRMGLGLSGAAQPPEQGRSRR